MFGTNNYLFSDNVVKVYILHSIIININIIFKLKKYLNK